MGGVTDILADAEASARGRNPQAVLTAFVPSDGLIVKVVDMVRLERLGSPLISGGTPKIADLLIAYGVLTDWPALEKAWRKSRLDTWLDEFAADLPAGEIPRIADAVTRAMRAAFDPADTAGTGGGDDPEKKLPEVADGGCAS